MAKDLEIIQHFLRNSSTIRKTATACGVSRCHVHKVLRNQVPLYYPEYEEEVDALLLKNKAESPYRAAIASHEKRKKLRQQFI